MFRFGVFFGAFRYFYCANFVQILYCCANLVQIYCKFQALKTEQRHQPVELQQGVTQPLALRLGNAQLLGEVLDVGRSLDDMFFSVNGKLDIKFYVFSHCFFDIYFLCLRQTKTFNPMRTLEFGRILIVLGVILLPSIFFIQNADLDFYCGNAAAGLILVGYFFACIDPRYLKEDWEVKEIEERWAEKKRAREQRRLQKQNGKAKH